MKPVGKFWFVVGIIVISSVLDFLISLPFSRILNTNDVISSTWMKEILSVAINGVSIFGAFLYALKIRKYVVPSTNLATSIFVGSGFLVLQIAYVLLLPLMLGSSNVFAEVSSMEIVALLASFVLAVILSFLSLKVLHKQTPAIMTSGTTITNI